MDNPRIRRITYETYDKAALIRARNEKGLSLRKVASDLGMSYANLCNIERGTVTTTPETIERLCLYYGKPADAILQKVNDPGQICV